MHHAPSVSYPVGRGAFQRSLYLFFVVATSALMLAWVLDQGPNRAWGLGVCLTLWGAVMGWRTWQTVGTLTWTGQAWRLQGLISPHQGASGTVQVILDVQWGLLLRWQPLFDTLQSQPVWLWLSAEQSSVCWHDLRCAVFQRTDLS